MQVIDDLKGELEGLYEDRAFPFYLLVGGILVAAFTQDLLWLGIGVVGFVALFLKDVVTG